MRMAVLGGAIQTLDNGVSHLCESITPSTGQFMRGHFLYLQVCSYVRKLTTANAIKGLEKGTVKDDARLKRAVLLCIYIIILYRIFNRKYFFLLIDISYFIVAVTFIYISLSYFSWEIFHFHFCPIRKILF